MSHALEKGVPLSQYRVPGTPRRVIAWRSVSWHALAFSCAKKRPWTNKREWSSTIKKSLARTDAEVFGCGTHGPTKTSVIHLSFGRSAS